MRVTAPAKINLHLRVGPPTADGFHPLSSWMVTVGLFDNLEFTHTRSPGVRLTCDDPALPTDASNLVAKCATALLDSAGLASSVVLGAVVVDEGAGDVAGHRRERRAAAGQGVEVLSRPVPDLNLESQVSDPSHPLNDRQFEEDHLGAHGQLDRPRSQWRPGLLPSVHVLRSLLLCGRRWLV